MVLVRTLFIKLNIQWVNDSTYIKKKFETHLNNIYYSKLSIDLKYVGCFADINQEDLNGISPPIRNSNITVLSCMHMCFSKGFMYAGLKGG